MGIFKARKIIDPRTGKERVISPEEQEVLLEKGIILDFSLPPNESADSATPDKPSASQK
jgi:hypothetical protein